MLRVHGISFSYGNKDVLRDIGFKLEKGELISVLGVNGSGKTTLLKVMGGLLKPKHGCVLLGERRLSEMTGNDIARNIGYMPQTSAGVLCTVFDAVLLGRKPHIGWEASAHDIAVAERVLKLLRMERYALKLTTELSGGELQKVIIARALAQEPSVLLLDEPINHLDIRNQLETMSLLREITRELGLITVTVLHDLSAALRFSDRFIMMKDGTVFACGGREVVTPESIKAVYRIDAAIHELGGVPVVVPR